MPVHDIVEADKVSVLAFNVSYHMAKVGLPLLQMVTKETAV